MFRKQRPNYAYKSTSFQPIDRDAVSSFCNPVLDYKEYSESGLCVWGWGREILSVFVFCRPILTSKMTKRTILAMVCMGQWWYPDNQLDSAWDAARTEFWTNWKRHISPWSSCPQSNPLKCFLFPEIIFLPADSWKMPFVYMKTNPGMYTLCTAADPPQRGCVPLALRLLCWVWKPVARSLGTWGLAVALRLGEEEKGRSM